MKGAVFGYSPDLSSYHSEGMEFEGGSCLPSHTLSKDNIIEKRAPCGAKVFGLVPLAATSFNGLEDESSFVPCFVDEPPVIVGIELGGVPLRINIPPSRIADHVSHCHPWRDLHPFFSIGIDR